MNLYERILDLDQTSTDVNDFLTFGLVGCYIRDAIENGKTFYTYNARGVFLESLTNFLPMIGNFVEVGVQGKMILFLDKSTETFLLYSFQRNGFNEEEEFEESQQTGEPSQDSQYKIFNIVTSDINVFEKFKDLCKKYIKLTAENSIHVLLKTSHGYQISSIAEIKNEFERGNYTDEVLEGFDNIVNNFSSKTPCGRLSIISGLPGGGKTYFVRGLIRALKNSYVIIIPSTLLELLDGPDLLPVLVEHKSYIKKEKNMVFVVEDADPILVKRMNDNVGVLSSLLNFTDGILGSALDVRIITTTNADKIEFDDALMRPGRLLSHIEIGTLHPEKCNEIYKRITGKEGNIKESLTLAEVYAKTKGQFKERKKDKVLGFAPIV